MDQNHLRVPFTHEASRSPIGLSGDTAGTVWIPGGTFLMGSNQHYPEEAPAHKVTVAGFWMETHTVTIEESGYQYEGRRYRSLSEIARHITGTQWSGPLFFGLKPRKAKKGAERA